MDHFFLYFNIFTVVNLSLLAILLYFRKNNSVTNRILAFIVINPALNFVNNIFILSGAIYNFPLVLFITFATAQLYAPLVLGYVNLMTGEKFRWISPLTIFTSIIILLDLGFGIEFLLMSGSEQKFYLDGLTSHNYPYQMNLINGLFVIAQMAYFIVALIKVRRYSSTVKGFFSDTEQVKLNYLQKFTILLSVLNFLLIVVYGLFQTSMVEFFFLPLIINLVYMFLISYAFYNQAIFTNTQYKKIVTGNLQLQNHKTYSEPLCREMKEISSSKTKYKLAHAEMDEYHKQLIVLFDDKKPYLDPDVNLTKVANDLGACSHTVSLTINTKFGMTFFNLINFYRIEEAKRLLESNHLNKLTVEAIGVDSGFNTISSFYRAFKKHTQMTPTEYIQQLEKDVNLLKN